MNATLQAQDLRIGNFVGLNLKEFKENYFTVMETAMSNSKFTTGLTGEGESYFFDCEDMEGIPLSPEWLERFQWTLHSNKMYWMSPFHKDFTITQYATTEPIFYYQHENYQVTMPDVKLEFVHQLQNLYFALTSTELTLKP